jgi:hypothetical protein
MLSLTQISPFSVSPVLLFSRFHCLHRLYRFLLTFPSPLGEGQGEVACWVFVPLVFAGLTKRLCNVNIDKGEEVNKVKRRMLWCILMVVVLVGSGKSLNFKQVAYIPSGIIWSTGYIKGMDANHDGYQDLVFSTVMVPRDSTRVVYYGYRPYNRYVFEDSIRTPPSIFWDISETDGDSLLDLITQRDDSAGVGAPFVQIYEPRAYLSFPKVPVWNWRYEFYGAELQPMYITDLDRDSLKEILTADAQVIYVFENRGDNQYVKAWSDTAPADISGDFANGDYDGDGRMEFVCGTYGSAVYVYKCTGPDQYQLSWSGSINTANMYDIISLPDIDGDGKPEFMIGSFKTPSPLTAQLHIFESTGINQYQVIFNDSIPVTDRGVYCVHSDCGDVDKDGKPELVWAIDRDWMVYKYDSLGHRFQRVFRAYGDNRHNSTNVHIHDMNGNGYPEIIESGGNETHIWEVEACRLVYPNGGETLYGDSQTVIRWRNVDPFQADSFSLFYSSDSGLTYSPVAHEIPGSDSAYTWTVPETYSDDCFVMLWAYQNATGWDFSDNHFRIRNGNGVEQGNGAPISTSHLPYHVAPNPFISFATVPGHEAESFALYDVSGRKVGVYKGDRIGSGLSAGIYFLKPEGQGAKPLRIVKLR